MGDFLEKRMSEVFETSGVSTSGPLVYDAEKIGISYSTVFKKMTILSEHISFLAPVLSQDLDSHFAERGVVDFVFQSLVYYPSGAHLRA